MSSPFWGETPPATPVPPAEAEAIAREVFGIDGTATPLGSNQETNLRVRAVERSYVLKIANPAFGADVLDLQNTAMQHVDRARTGLVVPLPVASRDGADLVVVPIGGVDHHVRLLTFVEGEMFSDAGYLGDERAGSVRGVGGSAVRRPGRLRAPGGGPRSAVRQPARGAGGGHPGRLGLRPGPAGDAVGLSDRAWAAWLR